MKLYMRNYRAAPKEQKDIAQEQETWIRDWINRERNGGSLRPSERGDVPTEVPGSGEGENTNSDIKSSETRRGSIENNNDQKT